MIRMMVVPDVRGMPHTGLADSGSRAMAFLDELGLQMVVLAVRDSGGGG